MELTLLYGVVLTAAPLLMSLTLHEFAHARTAQAFGDPTARSMGRCTLNPLAHLHPLGTLMMVFVGFGWAKPVPVNPNNLRPRRLGDIAVSLAGPVSNLLLAALCAGVLRIMAATGTIVDPKADFAVSDLVVFMLSYAVIVNICLLIFNLIPLFPLDGHHIGRETLPARLRGGYMQWQRRYGIGVFMALWIGPNLLSSVNVDFDPLGTYMGMLLYPTAETLLGADAGHMAWSSLAKFSGYLAWL